MSKWKQHNITEYPIAIHPKSDIQNLYIHLFFFFLNINNPNVTTKTHIIIIKIMEINTTLNDEVFVPSKGVFKWYIICPIGTSLKFFCIYQKPYSNAPPNAVNMYVVKADRKLNTLLCFLSSFWFNNTNYKIPNSK